MKFSPPIFLLYLVGIITLQPWLIARAQDTGGIPLGGIGTGVVEIMGDGRFDRFTLNHNPSLPQANGGGCFAAVAVTTSSGKQCKGLYQNTWESHGVQSVTWEEAGPGAVLTFSDPELPVRVRLEAFSPLIQRDLADSTYPGIVLQYTVENLTDEEMEVALAFSWENQAGMGELKRHPFTLSGSTHHLPILKGNLTGIQFQFDPETCQGQQQNAMGDYTLAAAMEKKDQAGFLISWIPRADPSPFWNVLTQQGTLPPDKPREAKETAGDARPAGALSLQRHLSAKGKTTFLFTLSWYMPHLVSTAGDDYGVFYANRWKSSMEAAADLIKNGPQLWDKMQENKRRLEESDIPAPLRKAMLREAMSLAAASVYLKDGRFGLLTSETPWPGNVGSPEEWLVEHPLLLAWYPELVKSELDVLASCQLADGEVPSAAGNLYEIIGTGNVSGGFMNRPDSTAAFVLMAFDYYLWTGDRKMLDALLPYMRLALSWLMSKDETGDGIPDGPSLFSPAPSGTVSLYTADLYLAALRVGEEMALLQNDVEFQSSCFSAREKAAKNLVSQLWNGLRFNPVFAPESSAPADWRRSLPLFPGEWFMARNGWNGLLDAGKVSSTLRQWTQALVAGRDHPQEIMGDENSPPARNNYYLHTLLCEYAYWGDCLEMLRQNDAGRNFLDDSAEVGAWALLDSLTGVAVDVPRACLVIGAKETLAPGDFSSPWFTPYLAGDLLCRRSKETGVMEHTLILTETKSGGSVTLREVAYKPFADEDAGQLNLKVLQDGDELAGQDFTREKLLAFRFNKPIKVSPGSSLTLVAAPKEGGKIQIRMKDGEITNLGTRCEIEKLRSAPGELSFRVINLDRAPQMIHLVILEEGNAESTIFLNGQRLAFSSSALETYPILLRSSPIHSNDFAWLQMNYTGCADAVRYLESSNDQRLKIRLWDMQTTLEQAMKVDQALRGFQVDVFGPKNPPKVDVLKPSFQPGDAESRIGTARQSMEKFLQEIPTLVTDPVLASELSGFFTPLSIQCRVDQAGMGLEPFRLQITVENPLSLPVRGRVGLELPEGWKAETAEVVEWDDREQESPPHRFTFTVTPSSPLETQRFEMQAVVSGTGRMLPFRKTMPVVVGHDFIKEWMIVGPFPNDRGEGFDHIYPPELNIKVDETYESLGKTIAWQKKAFPTGYIDLDSIMTPNDRVMAYAYVGIYSPRDQRVWLEVGADEGIKIFNNYKEISANSTRLRCSRARIGYRPIFTRGGITSW